MTTPVATYPSRRNRFFLLLIIALFVLPVVAAWILVGQWRPSGTTNHGELLNPAQPVPYLRLRQINGQEIDITYLQGGWTLMYLGATTAGCDKRCRDSLYAIRQVRLALGKDMERARTLFMMTTPADGDLLSWLQQEHVAMTVGVADAKTLEFFTHAFAGIATLGEWIYLVDPLGNLFMRYRADTNPKGILEDIRHLLKYSKIG
jgi:cytochrome oxidase Cu insertion factor (SCO1/SenC/PrrC family)